MVRYNIMLEKESFGVQGYKIQEAFQIVSPNFVLSLALGLSVSTNAVGNRVTAAGQPYTPNRLNQYTAVGAITLRHDPNGNLTFSATGLGGSASGGDGVSTYGYDSENHLRHRGQVLRSNICMSQDHNSVTLDV